MSNDKKIMEILEEIQEANDNIGIYMNCGQINMANEYLSKVGELIAELMSRPELNR